MEKKKIYIAIADTGGGHRAPAESLAKVFTDKYNGQYEVMVDNVFGNTKRIGKWMEKAYHFLNNRFTFLFSFVYAITDNRVMMFLTEWVFGGSGIRKTAEKLREFNPDLFISMHPAINYILRKSIEKSGITSVKAMIVTDPITAHRGWTYQRIHDLCIVFSEVLRKKFIRQGVNEKILKVYDPPLNPSFQRALSKDEMLKIKKEFGFPENKKIIFFAGSGEGFKNIEKYVKRILKKPELFEKAYFVIVTGRNAKQKENLEKMTDQYKDSFKIFGFTKQMYELTGSADLVVCKGGTSTTYQCLVLKSLLFT